MPDPAVPAPTTAERILEAAVEAASIHGISRLTVGDVARRAGVSRPTLYKHFPSKDVLVAAAVAREADRMVAAVVDAELPWDDPREGLEAGILAALHLAREHPLLDRVIRTEPETLVPLLVADGGPVIVLVRSAIEGLLRERFGVLDPVPLRRFADVVTRLIVSYAVSAPDDPPEVVAAAVAAILVDGAWSLASLPLPSAPPDAPGTVASAPGAAPSVPSEGPARLALSTEDAR